MTAATNETLQGGIHLARAHKTKSPIFYSPSVDLSMFFLQHVNCNLLAFLLALSHFDFEHYSWKKD